MNKICFSALLGVVITTSSFIAAADNKTSPGSACTSWQGKAGLWHTGPLRASELLLAYCPIVRENPAQRLGAVWVRLTDSTQADCRLVSSHASNGDNDSTDFVSQAGGSIRLDGDDLTHYSGGAYAAVCSVIVGGSIPSIRWEEPDDGSGVDSKVIPGAACTNNVLQPAGAFSAADGAYWNTGTSLIAMSCPIFRNQDLGNVDLIQVRVDPGSAPIRCWASSQDSGSMTTDTTIEHATSGSGPQVLSIDLDAIDQYSGGSVSVKCDVGAGGQVTSVHYQQ